MGNCVSVDIVWGTVYLWTLYASAHTATPDDDHATPIHDNVYTSVHNTNPDNEEVLGDAH